MKRMGILLYQERGQNTFNYGKNLMKHTERKKKLMQK
jgi:hypothetical protein